VFSRTEKLGLTMDCWACGVMMAETLLGSPLWTAIEELRTQQIEFVSRLSRKSFEAKMANPHLLNDALWAVLEGCLVLDPKKRMSSEQALHVLQSCTPASKPAVISSIPVMLAAAKPVAVESTTVSAADLADDDDWELPDSSDITMESGWRPSCVVL